MAKKTEKVEKVAAPQKNTSHFKLPGSVKRVMATIQDKHVRGAFKRAMISAELTYQANKKKAGRADASNSDD